MSKDIQLNLGSAHNAAEDFLKAWRQAERGEAVTPPAEVLYFENLETLLELLNSERWRLLKTLHREGYKKTQTWLKFRRARKSKCGATLTHFCAPVC